MCERCQKAVLKIAKADRLTVPAAIDWLWSNTSFPIGDGTEVLGQVMAYVRVSRRNRKRWLRKQHARAERMILGRAGSK